MSGDPRDKHLRLAIKITCDRLATLTCATEPARNEFVELIEELVEAKIEEHERRKARR